MEKLVSDYGGEGDDDVGGGVVDDDVGGGVVVQAQPFTGQLAHGGQADQGVAELEPGIAFHNFFFFFFTASGLVLGKGEGMAKKS